MYGYSVTPYNTIRICSGIADVSVELFLVSLIDNDAALHS